MKPQCENCKFFNSFAHPDSSIAELRYSTSGECRRRSPQIISSYKHEAILSLHSGETTTDTKYPRTKSYSWCGEFESKEDQN